MRRHRSRAESQSSLFDWHDRPFVPTCPRIKHRAQRQARLARQGHRRRRLGLAGASTMLSCPRSEAAIAADRAESGSPIVRGGKGAAATHIRSTARAAGPSFPVRRLEGVGRPGRAGPIFDGGVLQPCVGTVTRPSRLVGDRLFSVLSAGGGFRPGVRPPPGSRRCSRISTARRPACAPAPRPEYGAAAPCSDRRAPGTSTPDGCRAGSGATATRSRSGSCGPGHYPPC
jgi:hypothetical protein